MNLEHIPLRDDNPEIYLQAYWLDDSPEFQAGQRRPLVIVCPGGGYRATSDREAEPIALRFLAHGCHAAVLRYSVQTPLPAPMLDLACAILTVRERAGERNVDPDQIVLCGFSAGGHLAAALGVMWDKPELHTALGVAPEAIRPNALILGYAVIDLETVHAPPPSFDPHSGQRLPDTGIVSSAFGVPEPAPEEMARYRLDAHVSAATPPAFIWHTAADQVVPAANALRFAAALDAHQVPYELHIFQKGGHGLSLADETTDTDGHLFNREAQPWVAMAVAWLRLQRPAGT
jgi:acetyl esterase/lipase